MVSKSLAALLLAVSTPKRQSDMPELPTMAEASGIEDFRSSWYAPVTPAGASSIGSQ